MPETTSVVAVKLRYGAKPLWFDPVLGDYAVDDLVLVETERGREAGRVSAVGIEAGPAELKALSSPLKPVVRLMDEQDKLQMERMVEKSGAAMPLFKELVEKSGLEMKPVAVEYLFNGDKAVFYFASESRVDFRELVREMASRLHIRVELRQIGVRDEARMLGGISHCGEQLCCSRLGSDFQPVSIRMAKEQDLPLNPEKISGACGRLMCCLRYEFEAYKDFKGRAPKRGAEIETPLGLAKVTDYDTPREMVALRLEDGKSLSVPLGDFEPSAEGGEGQRPRAISREALERSASPTTLLALAALDRESLAEELAAAEALSAGGQAYGERRQRRGRGGARRAETDAAATGATGSTGDGGGARGARRGRRGGAGGDGGTGSGGEPGARATASGTSSSVPATPARRGRPQQPSGARPASRQDTAYQPGTGDVGQTRRQARPGRNSSGLRRPSDVARPSGAGRQPDSPAPPAAEGDGRRRRRRGAKGEAE